MSAAADALQEFHAFYGYDDPILGLRLRLRLINEEHEELVEEVRATWTYGMEHDLERIYKELADLVYVCYGMDLHLGGHLDRVLEEVHRSNMSKLWPCETCEKAGIIFTLNEDESVTISNCETCDGRGGNVKRREDGKVLKPPHYQPPDLSFVRKEPQDAPED